MTPDLVDELAALLAALHRDRDVNGDIPAARQFRRVQERLGTFGHQTDITYEDALRKALS